MSKKAQHMKFWVKGKKHSIKIQEELFKLGYYWYGIGEKYRFTNASSLFADPEDMTITFANGKSHYQEHPYKEFNLEELYMLNSKSDIRSRLNIGDMKFSTPDVEKSEEIQSKLVQLGFSWGFKSNPEGTYKGGKFLYAYIHNMKMTYGNTENNFRKHHAKETTLADLNNLLAKLKITLPNNMKFVVKDQIESEIIQEELFLLGFGWGIGRDAVVQFTDKKYLVADSKSMLIMQSNKDEEYKNLKEYTETTISQLYKLTAELHNETTIDI